MTSAIVQDTKSVVFLYTGNEQFQKEIKNIFHDSQKGEISILFSIVAAPIYIPTNSVLGFPFLHILANTCHLLSFW